MLRLWRKIYFIGISFWKFYEVRSKKGILFFVDNDPQGYKLSCCGSFVFLIFIQIAFVHTVHGDHYQQKIKSPF